MSSGSERSGGLPRREVLQLLAAGAAGAAFPASSAAARARSTHTPSVMPVIFAAHGNPMFMDDGVFMNELGGWAKSLPRPKAVLMVSAHWESHPLTIGATRTVPLVYDFYGFPERYYQVQYPAPGAPELAARVRDLLHASGQTTAEAPDRGFDHGAYVPLVCMYPEADIPVLQISLPSMNPQEVFEVGMALAPLRQEGVLLVGSGFLTHNLRLFRRAPDPSVAAQMKDFDHWNESMISARDFDALLDYRSRAPGVDVALPTHEHYVPVLFAAGASADRTEAVTYPITGFMFDLFTKRSVQFG